MMTSGGDSAHSIVEALTRNFAAEQMARHPTVLAAMDMDAWRYLAQQNWSNDRWAEELNERATDSPVLRLTDSLATLERFAQDATNAFGDSFAAVSLCQNCEDLSVWVIDRGQAAVFKLNGRRLLHLKRQA